MALSEYIAILKCALKDLFESFKNLFEKPTNQFDLSDDETIYYYSRFQEKRKLPVIKAGDMLFYKNEYYLILEEPVGLLVSAEDDGTVASDNTEVKYSRNRWAYPGISWKFNLINSEGFRVVTVLSERKILNLVQVISRDDDDFP